MIDHTRSNMNAYNPNPYGANNQTINQVPSGKPTILVADDSPIIGAVFKKALEDNEKYEVTVATDGTKAIEIIQSKGINDIPLLFLDLNMPKTNGFDVLEFLRVNNLFYNINVNIVSGNLASEEITRACAYPVKNVYDKSTLSIGKIQEIVASYDSVRR